LNEKKIKEQCTKERKQTVTKGIKINEVIVKWKTQILWFVGGNQREKLSSNFKDERLDQLS
jgi:hypothetical protein